MEGGKYWFGKTAYKVLKELVIPVKIKGRNLSCENKNVRRRNTSVDWEKNYGRLEYEVRF